MSRGVKLANVLVPSNAFAVSICKLSSNGRTRRTCTDVSAASFFSIRISHDGALPSGAGFPHAIQDASRCVETTGRPWRFVERSRAEHARRSPRSTRLQREHVVSRRRARSRAHNTASASTSASEDAPIGQVDAREKAKFESDAALWWNEDEGPFAALHAMNPVRVRFIRDALMRRFEKELAQNPPYAALREVKILDVGCGGGIFSGEFSEIRSGRHGDRCGGGEYCDR